VTRALVTGAAGFIGANLVRRLVADGHDVHMVVRPDSREWRVEGLPTGARLHEVDLEDRENVEKVVRSSRPEWIFHLAARGAYSWQADTREILRTNVIGTANLLEEVSAAGFDAFVYSGTSSEYGFKDHAPREDELVEPNSAYAVGKASGTMLCQLFARTGGHRVVVLRLYSVFGPWEEPGRLLPSLVLRGLAGGFPPLVAPAVSHDFVYMDDVIDAFLRAAGGPKVEPGAIFNVGSGVQTTIADAVDVARRVLAIEMEPQWGSMPSRAWDTSVWIADTRRIARELGWKATHSFEEGFRKQAEWFRAHEHLWPFYDELARARAAARR
jgi:nucleoside-diphosphate-sugar epimerase